MGTLGKRGGTEGRFDGDGNRRGIGTFCDVEVECKGEWRDLSDDRVEDGDEGEIVVGDGNVAIVIAVRADEEEEEEEATEGNREKDEGADGIEVVEADSGAIGADVECAEREERVLLLRDALSPK
jgi:antitoxin (DNA-binding transcriptional repressor) of toxin-antitoxin stability system